MNKLIPAMSLSEKQVCSRLACTAVERSDGASLLVGYLNLTERLLVFVYVFLQRLEETFRMFRSKNDPAAHLRFGHAGEHACEVDNEVGT